MKEYRIVQQIGEGKPYSLEVFKSFESCYAHLLFLIEEQQTHVNKKYFVQNSFFKNKYPEFTQNIKIYRIECRDVGNWLMLNEKIENGLHTNLVPFNKRKRNR